MTSRDCQHHPDSFCFICDKFIKKKGKKFSLETSVKVCEAYQKYRRTAVVDLLQLSEEGKPKFLTICFSKISDRHRAEIKEKAVSRISQCMWNKERSRTKNIGERCTGLQTYIIALKETHIGDQQANR